MAGFDLGAGLEAANSFYRAQEHGQDRDYLAKQRGYQSAVMDAGLSTLGDQTAAQSQQYKLAAAQSAAGLEKLPGQTRNDITGQELAATDLDFRKRMQPGLQAIQEKEQEFQATQQPLVQQVTAAANERGVADIPEQEAARVGANNVKGNERQMTAFINFGQAVKNNDKAGALQVANQWASTEALRQGTKGKNFVDVRTTGDASGPNGDTRAYQLVADDGSTFDLPFAQIKAAADRAKTGKYDVKIGKAGEVYTFNENTGAIKQEVAPSESYARRTNTGAKPAQLQMAEALMDAPENKGMTLTQALATVKTGLEKPRHQFLVEMAAKNALPGSDPAAEYEKWAKLYDSAKGQKPGLTPSGGAKPSNTVPNPMIDDRFNSLFQP